MNFKEAIKAKTGKELTALTPEMIEAVNVKGFTFSRWCIAGLVPTYAPRCECWRCREKRREAPNERLAMAVSIEAQERRINAS